MGYNPLAEPGCDRRPDRFRLGCNGGKGFHFGRRAVEHRDDPATFILDPVAIAQDRWQEPVRRAPNLLRGAVADLQRVRSAPHIDAEARP